MRAVPCGNLLGPVLKDGYFYPPTLFTDVAPSSTIAQVEIFGPVLAAMSFRTHKEAVKLANNTRYGLAASLWTENINLALDIAPQLKAGTVWMNCTNFFDAASGFGGYRESGFGREGGKEGLFEYVKPRIEDEFSDQPFMASPATSKAPTVDNELSMPDIDRTAKMYIGGKQSRPDGGYSMIIKDRNGAYVGEVSKGNRKDIRKCGRSCTCQLRLGNPKQVMQGLRYYTIWRRIWPFVRKNLQTGLYR